LFIVFKSEAVCEPVQHIIM